MLSALLKLITGVVFSLTDSFYLLTLTGIVGVISSTGGEIGPFLPVEQAALADVVDQVVSQLAGRGAVAGARGAAGDVRCENVVDTREEGELDEDEEVEVEAGGKGAGKGGGTGVADEAAEAEANDEAAEAEAKVAILRASEADDAYEAQLDALVDEEEARRSDAEDDENVVVQVSLLGGSTGSTAGASTAGAAADASSTDDTAQRPADDITSAVAALYGWYNALGYLTLACGALYGGILVDVLTSTSLSFSLLTAQRCVMISYAVFGLVKLFLYYQLSDKIEAKSYLQGKATPQVYQLEASLKEGAKHAEAMSQAGKSIRASSLQQGDAPLFYVKDEPPAASAKWYWFGLYSPRSRSVIAKLSLLFAIDAFAGGFTMQTFLAFWFSMRWDLPPAMLGVALSAANVLGGLSGIVAGYLVKRIGAVKTMVFTHLPSNLLLILIPVMPSQGTAVGMTLLRFCMSQMDVPARQAFVTSVVESDERAAAGGVTAIARSLGVSASPLLLAKMMKALPTSPGGTNAGSWVEASMPFFVAGMLKVGYDLALFVMFRERGGGRGGG
jgi:predicted MFS family arabinose efflux permease